MHFKLLKNKQKTQNKKEKSLGRSMVEMLGVLAIIGVLSIGGISGYTIAMRKYQANEIISSLQKYASLIYFECQTAIMNEPNRFSDSFSDNLDLDHWKANAWNCPDTPQYDQLGIGAMPNGIKALGGHPGNFVTSSDYILSNRSGDIVIFYVLVESEPLCQTIINTIGTKELSGKDGLCEKITSPEGYQALVSFIMN